MTYQIWGYFWLEWRLLLIRLEIKPNRLEAITDQIGGNYWPDWRLILTRMEVITDQIGGYYWHDWMLYRSDWRLLLIRLEAITDQFGGIAYHIGGQRLRLRLAWFSGWRLRKTFPYLDTEQTVQYIWRTWGKPSYIAKKKSQNRNIWLQEFPWIALVEGQNNSF